MARRGEELSERMFAFAVSIVKITNALPNTTVGRNIANQLFRAGTSAPSNYEEACAAESRADFVHKLQVVLKELREARFWLRLIYEASILPEDVVSPVYQEACELCNIIGKSVVTTKRQT
jgi:four helix bundle protein